MWRVPLALLAILTLTAFAPAPFLKKPKGEGSGDGGAITLESFQGRWRRTTQVVERGGALRDLPPKSITHVGITRDQWAFLPGGSTLILSIDATKTPAHLTFYRPGAPGRIHGVGLIRRHGKTVQVLYTWGGEERRPASFDKMPDGYWISTLIRD